jgi:hypothetical protein
MGLHTIDTVRRDSARNGLWFETEMEGGDDRVRVTVTGREVTLIYTIDIEKDVMESIAFFRTDGVQGELRFSYLQEIGEVGGEFAAPRLSASRKTPLNRLGGLWLVKLGDEAW